MRSFRLSGLLALSAALTVQAAALQVDNDADVALILARQAPGTPQYECHSNCGNAISGGRIATHCDNATWVGYYEACLDCALEYDIWKYYGSGVGTAASACGLTPTPSPSGGGGSSPSSTPPPSTSQSSSSQPSSTAVPDPSETSSEPSSEPSSTAEPDPSETETVSPSSTEPPESAGSSIPPSSTITEPPTSQSGTSAPVPSSTSSIATAGADKSQVVSLGALLGVGAFVAVFVNLMGA